MELRHHLTAIVEDAREAIVGLIVLGALAFVGTQVDRIGFWIGLAALFGLTALALVLMLGRERRRMTAVTITHVRPRGRFAIGMDVGRSRVTYGLLEVTEIAREGRLPSKGATKVVAKGELATNVDRHDLYGQLAQCIADVCRDVPSVHSVGIGVPGQVDPVRGLLKDSPGAFRHGEPFISNLAAACEDDRDIRRAFDLASASDLRHQIIDRCFLDNDVRCATRHVQSLFGEDGSWRNYACVFVGTGVGTGLVLDNSLFYGTKGSAGEAGHMTLHLSTAQFTSDGDGGTTTHPGLCFAPSPCACGRQGAHWENLINGPALVRLAEQTDGKQFARISTARSGEAHPKGISALDFCAIAHCLEGLRPKDELPEAFDASMLDDPDLGVYVNLVVRRYSYLAAVGIANLINILNLDHVALGGGVMDGMAPLRTFRDEWARTVEASALSNPARTLEPFFHQEGARTKAARDQPGWAWQGAALLDWDPSYHNYRNDASH
jgi:predicted NBD/HSP70 family sugar kinase